MVLASHDANGTKHSNIVSLSSRQLKWGATWIFGYFMPLPLGISVTSCQQHHQWYHSFPKFKMIEMRCYTIFCWVILLAITVASHDATGIGFAFMRCHCISVNIQWSEHPCQWGATWLCGNLYHQYHHQWYHCIPWAWWLNWDATWLVWSCGQIK